jgi:hypothetical protein
VVDQDCPASAFCQALSHLLADRFNRGQMQSGINGKVLVGVSKRRAVQQLRLPEPPRLRYPRERHETGDLSQKSPERMERIKTSTGSLPIAASQIFRFCVAGGPLITRHMVMLGVERLEDFDEINSKKKRQKSVMVC